MTDEWYDDEYRQNNLWKWLNVKTVEATARITDDD